MTFPIIRDDWMAKNISGGRKMNTLTTVSYITEAPDNVILLSELKSGMPKSQLNRSTELHRQGMRYEDIAKKVKRNKYEVLIALIHQAKSGKRSRPFANRI